MRGALLQMNAANIRVAHVLNNIGSDPTTLEDLKKTQDQERALCNAGIDCNNDELSFAL